MVRKDKRSSSFTSELKDKDAGVQNCKSAKKQDEVNARIVTDQQDVKFVKLMEKSE